MTFTIEKKRRFLWIALMLISLAGLALMFYDCYSRSDSEINRGNNASDAVGSPDNQAWHERLIFPFYFTFISNTFALVTSIIRVFNLVSNKRFVRRIELFMVVNLTITMFVYWITLFPKHKPDYSTSWASNFFVHLITPLMSIGAFIFQTFRNKETIKFANVWKSAAFHLLFPLIWVIVAVTIYFSLGAQHSAAIYHFMDLTRNPWWETIIYALAVPGAFYLFTILFIWISNPKSK